MPPVNSRDTLRQIATQMRSKVSTCEHYDPNVCSYEPDPEDIARVITKSGQPFRKKTVFAVDGQKIRLYANDDFLRTTLPFEIDVDPLSINRKDDIYFLEPAGEMKSGTENYQLFSHSSILNENQKILVQKPAFKDLINNVHLMADESVHVHGNGLRIYLFRPTADRAIRVMQSASNFLSQLVPNVVTIDFSSLPAHFRPLIPLIEKWGKTDDTERDESREQVSRTTLQALVDEIKPYIAAIDSYLDSFGDEPPHQPATALGALAEFAAETDLWLKETK